ncbi:hypothetical protein AND_006627 [Anopheles darlingi]|uniref:Reverse transcriptase domain-containing protein n=1 Tax=Anopheles darlingi TaxID=43151 RepID=W5JEC3_ANODA|nr:hypothetical protein AND_006627 [Anopheles darlingi]
MESNPIRIGTWNVLTLREDAKLLQLVSEAQQMELEILGLSEVRRPDFGEHRLASGHTLLHSGLGGLDNDGRKYRGVGFLLSERARHALLRWDLVSDRIIIARFKTDQARNLTILQVRAPTNSASPRDKKQFYSELEAEVEKVPQGDIRILMGDLNAQIGSDNKKYNHIMGTHGVDPPDKNGPLFVRFCNAHNMVIGGSLFRHRLMEKITWEMPKGYVKKQMDHICISKEWKKCLLDVRSVKSADIASDHLLVVGEIGLALETVQRSVEAAIGDPFNINLLSDRNVKDSFVMELRKRAENLPSTGTVEEQWTAIKDIFITTSEKMLGVVGRPGTKTEEWVSEETWQMIAKRKEAKAAIQLAKTVKKRIEADRRYTELKEQVDLAFQRDKQMWFDALAAEGEKAATDGDMKQLYEIIRRLKGDELDSNKPIQSKHGQLLTNSSDQLERWFEYFGQLLTPPTDNQSETQRQQLSPLQVTRISEVNSEEPTLQELEAAIVAMECKSEPGIDRISAEILKADPKLAAEMLRPLFCSIWKNATFPTDWMQGILVLVPKENTDTTICDNWRGVGQLCVAFKVLCKVILTRIQQKVDATLRRQQAGYRVGRSAIDHIATLRIIIEQMNESNGSLYMVFLEYEKAFNRLNHTYLWSALTRKGVPDKLVKLLATLYNSFAYRVRHNGLLSNPIRLQAGLIQDCPLSPLLFLIVMDEIMIGAIDRQPKRGLVWMEEQHLNDLSFAHDIVLLSTRHADMQSKLNDLVNYSTAAGLTINISKTKAMDVNTDKPSSFLISGQRVKKVVSFQYCGSMLATDDYSRNEN